MDGNWERGFSPMDYWWDNLLDLEGHIGVDISIGEKYTVRERGNQLNKVFDWSGLIK